MSKELNILQAIEMPVGTEFNVIHDNGRTNGSKAILEMTYDYKFLKWDNGENLYITSKNLTAKFIPIQKPFSFIEAVEASKEGKRLRVVHDAYCEAKGFKEIGKLFEMIISANKNFGDEIVNKAIIENILNGEWYIEEEN
ncbi:hypothetical protein GT646_07385 [Clostridium butyricum]|uniref:hypothetical protein n=1 Tax=Clostridium butyricum TaxID=1492 RepID=UPI00136D4BB5|nr:hypothetical protein [Clostridium butyricum]MZI80665.1 hypothetical protein [Clostridium butyricum]